MKNRFFALLFICLSSLLSFSCSGVDTQDDDCVYIPVDIGISLEGQQTRTLMHKYSVDYLYGFNMVMYYGPVAEPRKYGFNLPLSQSQFRLEENDSQKFSQILLQVKSGDLGKEFCFTLVAKKKGQDENGSEIPTDWTISGKGRIFNDDNENGTDSILIGENTKTFILKFELDTLESYGKEGAKGQVQIYFKPTISAERFNYNAVFFLCKEEDGEYKPVFGKCIENVDSEYGFETAENPISMECGQYLLKIYCYLPDDSEFENKGKCFGMYSSVIEFYEGNTLSCGSTDMITFSVGHTVSSAPAYSDAKELVERVNNGRSEKEVVRY